MKIYLAAPFGEKGSEKRAAVSNIAQALRILGHECYCPWEHEIPHAWEYPNNEWGLMVFEADVAAIQNADLVIVCSYGREQTTSGTNWEAGYAYGIGKFILLLEMTENVMSLMVANGRLGTVKYSEDLSDFKIWMDNFGKYYQMTLPDDLEFLVQTRTNTEQK